MFNKIIPLKQMTATIDVNANANTNDNVCESKNKHKKTEDFVVININCSNQEQIVLHIDDNKNNITALANTNEMC